ncbi:esterase/lipase family protein [Haliea sp.]|uniref:esterase/lipase family protein n=1 Tax=Haliea sp. TaxID=1932666 RepID=UPI003528E4E2
METGKALRGSTHLAFDAVDGVTHIVEGMYRNIAAGAWPLGKSPEGPAPGIAGFVHTAIRQVSGISRSSLDLVLKQVAPRLDSIAPPGPRREAVIAALNGVCGDHLARTGNPLAIQTRLRVGRAGPSDNIRKPGGRLLIAIHGLSMNDQEWTWQNQNHIETLANQHGFTPVYVSYNSGKHISDNGRELSAALDALVAGWPLPVESITLIGFSMGGLVARSAMLRAQQRQLGWINQVDKAVYIGTPHHGAVLERGGFWLQKLLTYSPYTAPFAVLGRIRSDGIIDLRHGNLRDEDWQHHDADSDNGDYRVPTPLAEGIEHYAIAATLSKKPGERLGRLLGDGLVHPSSATGRHANPRHDLGLNRENTRILYDLGHLGMLCDPRVSDQLASWLGRV